MPDIMLSTLQTLCQMTLIRITCGRDDDDDDYTHFIKGEAEA